MVTLSSRHHPSLTPLYLQLLMCLLLMLLAFYSLTAVLIYALMQYVNNRCNKLGVNNSPLTIKNFAIYHFQMTKGCLLLLYWRLKPNKHALVPAPQHPCRDQHILCVHGFQMNGTCFEGLRQVLHQNGYNSSAVDLGKPYIPVANYVRALEQQLERLNVADPEQKISIIAHSMGGLVVRMLLAERPDMGAQLQKVITLGTPHQGTALFDKLNNNWLSRVFHPHSEQILNLANLHQSAPALEVISIASEHDLIVFPAEYALLENSQHEKLTEISHAGLLTEKYVHQRVIQHLKTHSG